MDKYKPNFINPEEIQKRDDKNIEAFFKSSEEGDRFKTDFDRNKFTIEGLLGIKLTNIELVGLRKITKDVVVEAEINNKNTTSHWSAIFDVVEAPLRFMYQFYGIHSMGELRKAFPPDKTQKDSAGNVVWPTPMMREFFQREQAKLHHEI